MSPAPCTPRREGREAVGRSERPRSAPTPSATAPLTRPRDRDHDRASPQVLQLQGQVVAQEAVQLPPPGLPRERNPQHLVQVPGRGKEKKITARLWGLTGGAPAKSKPTAAAGQSPGLQAFQKAHLPPGCPLRDQRAAGVNPYSLWHLRQPLTEN